MNEDDLSLEVPRWVYPLGVGTQLCTALAAGYAYLGMLLTAPVVLAGAAAFAAWLATSYRDPRRRRILPLYLGLVVVLLLQGLEQWQFGFARAVPQLFPASFAAPVVFDEKIQLAVFTLAAVTLYLLGALGLFFHHPLGNYMGWFVMAYAVVGGLALFAMAFAGGRVHYIPGMASACIAIPLGIAGAARLARPR